MHKDNFKNVIYVACVGTLILLTSPRIDSYHYNFLSKKGISQEGVLYKMLGEARKILSIQAYMAGDDYYHGGITRRFIDECKKVEETYEKWCPKCKKFTDHHGHEHKQHDEGENHHECEHHDKYTHKEIDKHISVSKFNILPYIGETIKVGKHIHLHGEEEKEMLPWFYYAVRLDPKNVDAYALGGYWVASRIGQVDEGIKFLREGISNNPEAWQIYSQLGRIYFWEKEDYAQALENYSKAYMLMTDENSDKHDKRSVYFFTGFCYEKAGHVDKALEYYRKLLVLFPNDENLSKKIITLSPNN